MRICSRCDSCMIICQGFLKRWMLEFKACGIFRSRRSGWGFHWFCKFSFVVLQVLPTCHSCLLVFASLCSLQLLRGSSKVLLLLAATHTSLSVHSDQEAGESDESWVQAHSKTALVRRQANYSQPQHRHGTARLGRAHSLAKLLPKRCLSPSESCICVPMSFLVKCKCV